MLSDMLGSGDDRIQMVNNAGITARATSIAHPEAVTMPIA